MIADYIRHLRDLAPADANSVGVKAATLGDLMRAGFHLPGGFCLPASAYRHFVACAGLERHLADIFSQADLSNPAHCEAAAAEIHRLFLAARLPSDMRRAIEHAYLALSHRLGLQAAPVAVRASPLGARAYDLPPDSHETLLNVVGVEPLGAALKHCWASLHSSRALQTRAAPEVQHQSGALPLVVQALVGAAASGRIFTADPATGDPLHIVIEACFGLGEGMAGGVLGADRLVVDAASIQVARRRIADKSLMVGRAQEPAQGTVVAPVPQARRRLAALHNAQAVALARVAMQIDQHFDARCEIDWAIADGDIFVLSARPISRLPAFFPVHLADGRRTFTWMLRRPDPVPPLSADLWRLIVRPFNRSAARGRRLGIGSGRWHLALVNGYQFTHRQARDPWRPRSLPAVALRFLLQAPLANALHGRWQRFALPRAQREQQRLAELARRSDPPSSAVAQIVLGLARSLEELLGSAALLGPLAREVGEPAPRLLAWLLGPDPAPHDLLPASQGMTAQRTMALWRLIRRARQDVTIQQAFGPDIPNEIVRGLEADAGGRALLDEIRAFAAQHALLDPLSLADLDEGPAWMQDVGSLLITMRQHLFGAAQSDPEQALSQRAALSERAVPAARARLSAGPLGRFLPWRRWLFDYLLRTARALRPLADDCRENAPMQAAAALREALRLLAGTLVREGHLESPDELAFLTLADMAALARGPVPRETLRAAVEPRRRRLRRLACLTPPARIPPPSGVEQPQPAPSTAPADAAYLSGAPCSPGTATGPARYVDSPRDLSHFRRGDVLVCGRGSAVHAILFSMAAALVQEEESLTPHCALLAREHGLPVVAGVSGLARRVREGQVLTVDGTSGTVSLEPEAQA